MKLFSDFRSCYCGTANLSPPHQQPEPASPSPLPANVQDRRTRWRRSKDLDRFPSSESSSVWRPKLSAIVEDHVISPTVENEKSIESEGGSSRKRWRRKSELKKPETFNHGDGFIFRRKSSFSMSMLTFSATPFMI